MEAESKKSISDNMQERKKHSVDVHFTLPLLFKRLYFVLSSGTDVRANTTNCAVLDMDKRAKTQVKDIMLMIIGFLIFSSFFGTLFYKIIQIMADR